MAILAIDTCEIHCSVGLWQRNGACFSKSEPLGRGHAERLLPMLDDLYAEAAIHPKDLDKIAVTVGPGTFTGLRIGLSVARGLAFALDIPCVGISLLEALAQQSTSLGAVHVHIKGRGEHGFYQGFDRKEDGSLTALSPPQNLLVSEIHDLVGAQTGAAIGSGFYADFADTRGQRTSLPEVFPEGAYCDPVKLARYTHSKDPGSYPPEPLYVRPPDAVKKQPVFKTADLEIADLKTADLKTADLGEPTG